MNYSKKQTALICHVISGNFVSGLGSALTLVAVPLYMLKMANGNQWYGFICLIASLASFVITPYLGGILDRFSRKKVILINQSFCCIVMALSALILYKGHSPNLALMTAVYLTSSFYYTIHNPSLLALSQQIFKKHNYKSFNKTLEIQAQISMMLGGALSAFVLEKVPLEIVFFIDAFTYLLAISIYTFVKVPKEKFIKNQKSFSFLKSFRESYKFYLENRFHMFFYFLTFIPYITVMIGNYFWPVHIVDTLKSGAFILGGMGTLFALGAVVGGLVSSHFAKMKNNQCCLVAFFIYMISFTVACFARSEILFLFTMSFLGFGNALLKILRNTIMMHHVPKEFFGRVSTFFYSVRYVMQSVLIGFMSISVKAVGIGQLLILVNIIIVLGFVFLLMISTKLVWVKRVEPLQEGV